MKNVSVIYIVLVAIIIIGTLSTYSINILNKNKKLERDLSIALTNEKAHIAQNNKLLEYNIEYQYTIEQLNYYNDSILIKLNNTRKELKVKDTEIKNLQYLLSKASKKDSIYIGDTIFKDADFKLDTLIRDEWYKVNLGLEYPNLIVIEPEFKSEKHIITNYKEETVEPPKKCLLARLFQKKHKVVEVTVVEKCPYIEDKEQVFIEVIR